MLVWVGYPLIVKSGNMIYHKTSVDNRIILDTFPISQGSRPVVDNTICWFADCD